MLRPKDRVGVALLLLACWDGSVSIDLSGTSCFDFSRYAVASVGMTERNVD